MNLLRKSLIMSAAYNLKEYLDEKHCVDADVYDLIEILNLDLGWLVDAVAEAEVFGRNLNSEEY